jgi:hypothetical protein
MKHIGKPHTQTIIGLLLVDIVFFSLTDPLRVPSGLLIVAFLLFSVTLYLGVRQLLRVAETYGIPLNSQTKRLALIITGVISGLIALQ